MTQECFIDDIRYINNILSDSLMAINGEKVDTMSVESQERIFDFNNENITNGLIAVFRDKKLFLLKFCENVNEAVKEFKETHGESENVSIRVLYNVKNVYSQERALKLIENYLSLIFKI